MVCRNCKKTKIEDRPTVCSAIECEDFQPCPQCGLNRTLHDTVNRGRLCKVCVGITKAQVPKAIKELEGVIFSGEEDQKASDASTGINIRGIGKITTPGTPPPDLDDQEKEYYMNRWREYEGYYRNPSAYYNVHQLILLEIHSSYLNNKLISSRGELQSELSRELQVTVNLRKVVSDQLPEKEAEDVMDDEKSLAVIYEKYKEEKKLRSVGPVSRVFRRDTLALAPHLYFEINPKELLERCGFKVVDIEKILPRIQEFTAEQKKTPEQILEFFGFNLTEEFAMSTKERGVELSEDDFDPEELLYGSPE